MGFFPITCVCVCVCVFSYIYYTLSIKVLTLLAKGPMFLKLRLESGSGWDEGEELGNV